MRADSGTIYIYVMRHDLCGVWLFVISFMVAMIVLSSLCPHSIFEFHATENIYSCKSLRTDHMHMMGGIYELCHMLRFRQSPSQIRRTNPRWQTSVGWAGIHSSGSRLPGQTPCSWFQTCSWFMFMVHDGAFLCMLCSCSCWSLCWLSHRRQHFKQEPSLTLSGAPHG